MTQPTPDEILDILATLPLPDGSGNLAASGRVTGLSASQTEGGLAVSFVIEIDPSEAAAMESLREKAQEAVAAHPGVAKASAVLAAHKAPPQGPKAKPKNEARRPDGVRKIIAVASGKGGVGKSTVAVNLALALAGQGLRVGLLDVDVYGPSVPRLLGLDACEVLEDEKGRMIPLEASQGLKAMSIGFLVDADAPMLWRGPMVHSALGKMLFDVAWGELDALILDMPPGTGDASLSIASFVPLDGAVVVSTPQDLALLDVRKGIGMFAKLNVPLLGMIENMSGFECPHCHQTSNIFGCGGAKADAQRLGIPFLGAIPLTMELRKASDAGAPLNAQEGKTNAIFTALGKELALKLV